MPSVEEPLSAAEVDANTRSAMDSRIEIDADTRIIQMMPQDELFGVESDEKSERTTTYEGGVAKEYTVDGKTSVCWRGKENFWGNIWKFVCGINIWGNGKMGAVSLTFVLTSTLLKTKIAETMNLPASQ